MDDRSIKVASKDYLRNEEMAFQVASTSPRLPWFGQVIPDTWALVDQNLSIDDPLSVSAGAKVPVKIAFGMEGDRVMGEVLILRNPVTEAVQEDKYNARLVFTSNPYYEGNVLPTQQSLIAQLDGCSM